MSAAGTPRGRLATAVVIALAAIAGLAVIGGTPAPAPALPPTDSTTTGDTTGPPPAEHTLTLEVQGPGQVSGSASCSTSINTPNSTTTASCTSIQFIDGDSLSFTASKRAGDDANFLKWVGGTCDNSTSTTCTVTPSSNLTLTAVFVDNTGPSVTVSSPAPDELFVKEPGASVVVTGSPGSTADPSAVRGCAFDSALVFGSCQAVLSDNTATGATTHSVAIRDTDPSGNWSTVTRSFRVYILDTTITGPSGTVTAPPTFDLGSTKQDSTFLCRVDGGTEFVCPSSYTADLPDGAHTLAARAVHTYETTTRSDPSAATASFTIDRPDPIPPGPGPGNNGNTGGTGGSGDPTGESAECTVPKLKGKTLRASKRALGRAGCKLGKVTKKSSARVKKGRVVKSRPAAGSKRPAGAKVALVLSKG